MPVRKVARRGELDVRLDVAEKHGVALSEASMRPSATKSESRAVMFFYQLSVHVDDSEWSNDAERILKDTGADEISSTSEAKGDYANADKPMPRYQK